ncbi:MAG: NahK/ErcS family hybrid sensor histidine kinase/response regulator [Stappiaceae bacterium]
MLQGWAIAGIALVYIGVLFAIAALGDRSNRLITPGRGRPMTYALSLAVYCTSWTFFGSVGLAAESGLEFLTIYIGPIILFSVFNPFVRRVVRLSKSEKITSIADFIAARYGKNQGVAAVVTVIALVGTVPYIALQLKAISLSVTTLLGPFDLNTNLIPTPIFGDITLLVAIGLAIFAVLFGTRHTDATEHQEGLMLAIAAESVIKLLAFISVGIFATFYLFGGPEQLFSTVETDQAIREIIWQPPNINRWIVLTLLSFCAAILLPRQFHVTMTENNSEAEVNRAIWLFPVYLILINLFVLPIAAAGMLTFGGSVNADIFVLALPLQAQSNLFSLIAFIGGLSAATAMVIVATVALAIMISNDIVMPLLLRRRIDDEPDTRDMGRFLLKVRRLSILFTVLLGYAYYRAAGDSAALASIGLVAFAAIAQFAPAFFGGLFWRRGTARGAISGMAAGFLIWAYTLLLPTFAESGIISSAMIENGPFGIWQLRPQGLFGFITDPFIHGVYASLFVNIVTFVGMSFTRQPFPVEKVQANIFVPSGFAHTPTFNPWHTSLTIGDLQGTVARYLGEERTGRSFARFGREHGLVLDAKKPADAEAIRFSEQLLASAIGASSARLVLTLLVKKRDPATKGAMKLLDDASVAIQYNRDLLQTALDQVRQGISVFDSDLRLITWNRQFRILLDLPADFGQVGTTLDAIIRFNAERGEFGPGPVETIVADRLEKFMVSMQAFQEPMSSTGIVLEIRVNTMPNGGIVVTYDDVTERVSAENAVVAANESLERRVKERTEELTHVNHELVRAKRDADDANLGKTRFLAAAGHDILQPLNAARLYASSLVDRFSEGDNAQLVHHVEESLESVEEIIGAVLDISRLDTGKFQTSISVFRLEDIFIPLRNEFEAVAREKNLQFTIVPTSTTVRSDRRLLRRLLQNLISNALKYTENGRVLVGCRHRGGTVSVDVYDTGIGIPQQQQQIIFQEFQRLDEGIKTAKGLGLGLSIVERIAQVLAHDVNVTSQSGRGTHFSVSLPIAATVPVTPARKPLAALRHSLEGLTVLAIDNEPKILSGMETLLGGWQCDVLTAGTPEEALQTIRSCGKNPNVLLVDYHLDDGNGIDAIVHLRWKLGTDLPAVLITADRTPAVRKEARSKDIELLNKPVKPAALRALLTQASLHAAAAE